ncbi:MAG: glycosyltransferase family 39 protein, partial [Ardenticatenaceae bacterium]
LRILSALLGTLAIPALFAFARQVAGRRVALSAALLLATFPMHLHYSRIAVFNVWDTFTYPATLAALWWGMRHDEQGSWPFVLAALVAGFGQYPYTGSRLLPLLVGLFLVALSLFEPDRLRGKVHGIFVMILLFAVIAAPHYLYGFRHPDEFNARINQVGILQSGWLAQEAAARGEGTLPVLWDQFRRALFGFGFFHDRSASWGAGAPLTLPLLSIGLFFGLVVTLRRLSEPAVWLIHGWFWAVILAGGMLTLSPPTSNRLVAATPVVCLLAAIGWNAAAVSLARARPRPEQRMTAPLLLALFAGVIAFTGIRAHQRYLASNRYGGTEALIATLAAQELLTRPSDTTLVMVGAPRLYSDISPLAFLTTGRGRTD